MFRFVKRLAILVFILFLVALAHWTYGYLKNKNSGSDSSFIDIAKNDSAFHYGQMIYLEKNFSAIVEHAIQNDDKVKRGALNAVSTALEMYKAENDKYPDNTDALLGNYIESTTEIVKNPDFKYTVSADGLHYKMSIPLNSGELYSVEK